MFYKYWGKEMNNFLIFLELQQEKKIKQSVWSTTWNWQFPLYNYWENSLMTKEKRKEKKQNNYALDM